MLLNVDINYKIQNSLKVGRRRSTDFVDTVLHFIQLTKKQNQNVPMIQIARLSMIYSVMG